MTRRSLQVPFRDRAWWLRGSEASQARQVTLLVRYVCIEGSVGNRSFGSEGRVLKQLMSSMPISKQEFCFGISRPPYTGTMRFVLRKQRPHYPPRQRGKQPSKPADYHLS